MGYALVLSRNPKDRKPRSAGDAVPEHACQTSNATAWMCLILHSRGFSCIRGFVSSGERLLTGMVSFSFLDFRCVLLPSSLKAFQNERCKHPKPNNLPFLTLGSCRPLLRFGTLRCGAPKRAPEAPTELDRLLDILNSWVFEILGTQRCEN